MHPRRAPSLRVALLVAVAALTCASVARPAEAVDPLPTLDVVGHDVTEGPANTVTDRIAFDVVLSGPSASTVTVNYHTGPLTALEQSDFIPTQGSLTFPPSATAQSQTVTVGIVSDTIKESGGQRFYLYLTHAVGATLVDNNGRDTARIFDRASLGITGRTVTETDADVSQVTFDVVLTGITSDTVTAHFHTNNFTAIAGQDYVTTTGDVSFPPSASPAARSIPVSVVIKGNDVHEKTERFYLYLVNAVGDVNVELRDLARIVDDD
jgi:hypothetical protein